MPDLELPRQNLSVIWLSNGQVFAIGGSDRVNDTYSIVEMLNREWNFEGESTGVWCQVASMQIARSNFAAVVFHDLTIVAGGTVPPGAVLKSVEFFRPPQIGDLESQGQWTLIQSLPSAMWCHAGVCYGDSVYVFGKFFASIKYNVLKPTLSFL